MKIKKYKNGNFAVKREPDYDSHDERGMELLIDLCNSSELDFVIAGDEGCAGNYDMYYPLYNAYTGMMYLPTGKDCSNYNFGEWIHLYGKELDAYDIESLLEEDIITEEQIRKFSVYQLDMWADEDGGWRQNNQYLLGEIKLAEYKSLKMDVLRALHEQLNIKLDPHYTRLDDTFAFDGGYEVVAKRKSEPLFYLQEVR